MRKSKEKRLNRSKTKEEKIPIFQPFLENIRQFFLKSPAVFASISQIPLKSYAPYPQLGCG